MPEKICTKCLQSKPLDENHWYKARPRKNHKSEGWQSYCRDCWRQINKNNKLRRKNAKKEESDTQINIEITEISRFLDDEISA